MHIISLSLQVPLSNMTLATHFVHINEELSI